MPRLSPAVADTTRLLTQSDHTRLKKRILEIQQRFPELALQVVVHGFGPEHPFSMHAFWLFNAGNFAGDGQRGKDNRSLMVALDPGRGESAIVPGYGLEPFLKGETLDHLLELAGPAWEAGRWADGLLRVLDGLDQLLESIASPEEKAVKGEF